MSAAAAQGKSPTPRPRGAAAPGAHPRPRSEPMRVPFFEPQIGEPEIEAVAEVIRSGWITMGPKVEAFERRFADLVGRRHAVAVNSCTAALHLANLLLDIGPGDEVVLPSLTFAATANAVVYAGATPVFADIAGSDDWCIDPADVARRLTPRTKAVVAMHYAGFPCDMAALQRLCARHGLALYEDACHGIGGRVADRPMGALGRIGCFSFFSNKAMTTAEGGVLVTDDEALAARARRLRSHGQTATAIDRVRGAQRYDVAEVGFNYRLDDIRAAIGLAQLDRLDGMQAARRSLVADYRERLAGIDGIRVPGFGARGEPANYLMPVLVTAADRDAVRKRLAADGVQTSLHYPPVHLFSHYRDGAGALPETEAVAAKAITLPLYPSMSSEQVAYVCDRLAAAVRGR